jgi:hypothetical protein
MRNLLHGSAVPSSKASRQSRARASTDLLGPPRLICGLRRVAHPPHREGVAASPALSRRANRLYCELADITANGAVSESTPASQSTRVTFPGLPAAVTGSASQNWLPQAITAGRGGLWETFEIDCRTPLIFFRIAIRSAGDAAPRVVPERR